MNNKKRLGYFDLAKGIAIISMIVGHYCQLFIKNEIIYNIFYSFHMPLFFLISGYFITNRTIKWQQFVMERVKRLVFPYFVIGFVGAILNFLRVFLGSRNLSDSFNVFLKGVYAVLYGTGTGKGCYLITPHGIERIMNEAGMIWFLLALFWGTLIVYSLRRVRAGIIIVIVITIIGYYSSKIIWLPFSIQNGMNATIFIYLGYVAKKYSLTDHLKADYKNYICVIISIIIWVYCIIYGKCELFCNHYKNGILDVVGAICASFVILFACKMLEKFRLDLLKWYGKNTLNVLMFHYVDVMVCYFMGHRIITILFTVMEVNINQIILMLFSCTIEIAMYYWITKIAKKSRTYRKIFER